MINGAALWTESQSKPKVYYDDNQHTFLVWDLNSFQVLWTKYRMVMSPLGPKRVGNKAPTSNFPCSLSMEQAFILSEIDAVEFLEAATGSKMCARFLQTPHSHQRRKRQSKKVWKNNHMFCSSTSLFGIFKRLSCGWAKLISTKMATDLGILVPKMLLDFLPILRRFSVFLRRISKFQNPPFQKINYPESILDQSLLCVFRDLWQRGHFVASGIKYGGDFLVYAGNPEEYHSFATVKVISHETVGKNMDTDPDLPYCSPSEYPPQEVLQNNKFQHDYCTRMMTQNTHWQQDRQTEPLLFSGSLPQCNNDCDSRAVTTSHNINICAPEFFSFCRAQTKVQKTAVFAFVGTPRKSLLWQQSVGDFTTPNSLLQLHSSRSICKNACTTELVHSSSLSLQYVTATYNGSSKKNITSGRGSKQGRFQGKHTAATMHTVGIGSVSREALAYTLSLGFPAKDFAS